MRRCILLLVSFLVLTGNGSMLRGEGVDARVGAGVLVATSPYQGVDVIAQAIPLVSVRYGPFFVQTGKVGAEFDAIDDVLTVSVFLDPFSGARYSVDGSDLDTGYDEIEDRERQFAAGVEFDWDIGWGDLRVSTSMSLAEEGFTLGGALSRPSVLARGSLLLVPRIGITMLDGDYADSYFGVSPAEAAANTAIDARYSVGEVVSLEASLLASYRFAEGWPAFGMVGAEFLSSEAEDSPIVEENMLAACLLGVMYSF